MKTFAEMLPTATDEMREFVEAYVAHEDHRLCDKYGYQIQGGLILMRSTPPAKEPVSVDLVLWHADNMEKLTASGFTIGDRVRVVKIGEAK